MRRAFLSLLALTATSVSAQSPSPAALILSEKFGRPMTVGSQQGARAALQASDLSGVAAVELFHALCLTGEFDAASFTKAVEGSATKLTAQEVTLEPEGNTPAFRQNRYVAQGVLASWWNGSEDGLENRLIAIRDRGVTTTGKYGSFKAAGRQCNVSMTLAQVGDLQTMADRLGALTGGVPIKVVIKPKWADGSWALPGSAKRVSFAVVDAGTRAALVHFTIQEIEGAKP